jgi:LacI family repressor for deo operon, udp, cdd, tsx, nupC, and nupG
VQRDAAKAGQVMKRPTIGDVARLAGVSTATVSRALHSPEVVSEAARNAVLEAVRNTGYTQNTAAQSLRQRRAKAVLVLVPDIGNTFFSEILAGIERVASAAGQTILIGDTANDVEREEDFLRYLRNGRADGVLLLNGRLPPSIVAGLEEDIGPPPPMVTISEALDRQVVPHVGIDNVAAAEMAVRHLLDLGHRRIAHLCGPAGNILTRQRLAGYRRAMAAAGVAEADHTLLSGDFTAESGGRAALQLLAMAERPSAIFCSNDEMAMGLISVLHGRGIAVPGDLSVVGFDDIVFAKTYIPALTTIHQPRLAIGERAMQILLGMLDGTSGRDPRTSLLEARLVVRASTAAPRSG